MERRLERVSDIAADVTLAALNGDVKLTRCEPDELAIIHEQMRTYVDHLEREVERLTKQLDAFEETVDGPAVERSPGHPAPTRADLPSGRRQSRGMQTADTPTDNSGVEVGDITPEQPSQDATLRPVEELIPGTNLRDM